MAENVFYQVDGRIFDSIKHVYVDSVPTNKSIREHLLEALFRRPTFANIQVIPTWSCNLRCPFCYVNKQLDREFRDQAIDPQQLVDFMTRLRRTYNLSTVTVTYIGGEPLLGFSLISDIEKSLKDLDFEPRRNMTTNLSVDLTPSMIDFILSLNHIAVSLDGDEHTHNKMRVIYKHDSNDTKPQVNVYRKVMQNLRTLIDAGIDVTRLVVQGGMSLLEDADLIDLVYDLLEVGVPESRIKCGKLAPTDKFVIPDYTIPPMIRRIPCCSFRYMSYFVVDESGVYTNYFKKEGSRLGDITDDLIDIESQYRLNIIDSMPIFRDDNCMSCSVVGLCWGNCIGHIQSGKISPSSVCSQRELIEMKDELCANPQKFYEKFGSP